MNENIERIESVKHIELERQAISDCLPDQMPDFASDYKFAIIHLLWGMWKGKRHLVFGMLEMYPSEFDVDEAPEIEEQTSHYRHGQETYRLFYIRYKECDVNKAIQWYRDIKEKKHINLYWDLDKDGNLKNFPCEQMIDIRSWPNFELAKKTCGKPEKAEERENDNGLPFIAEAWGVVRTHHLYPEVYKDQELYDLLMYKEPLEWIQKYLMWDISFYGDLIGSVHLVLPNPIYSSRRIRVIPRAVSTHKCETGQNGNEKNEQGQECTHGVRKKEINPNSKRTDADEVRITFTPRKDRSLKDISVRYCEKTITGTTIGYSSNVVNNFCTIPLIGKEDKFSFEFKDSEYGFIDYTNRASFILGFQLDVIVAAREKRIQFGNNINTVTEYEKVTEISTANTTSADECDESIDADAIPLQEKMTREEWKRRKYYEGQRYGQKIFQDHEEAKYCIKEIIHNAKNKLILVDPYITINDFFEYALEGTRRGLEVILLTGKDDFKKNQTPELLERVKNLAGQENIRILGMTGRPKIHDRFIMVDDDIWLIGGSLNFIGKRLSVMLKSPNPKPLEECLNKIIYGENVRDFNEWYNESYVDEDDAEKDATDDVANEENSCRNVEAVKQND